jgi:hypothetical protein
MKIEILVNDLYTNASMVCSYLFYNKHWCVKENYEIKRDFIYLLNINTHLVTQCGSSNSLKAVILQILLNNLVKIKNMYEK